MDDVIELWDGAEVVKPRHGNRPRKRSVSLSALDAGWKVKHEASTQTEQRDELHDNAFERFKAVMLSLMEMHCDLLDGALCLREKVADLKEHPEQSGSDIEDSVSYMREMKELITTSERNYQTMMEEAWENVRVLQESPEDHGQDSPLLEPVATDECSRDTVGEDTDCNCESVDEEVSLKFVEQAISPSRNKKVWWKRAFIRSTQ